MDEIEQGYLEKIVKKRPEAVFEIFRSYDASDDVIRDRVFDRLLGISWQEIEQKIDAAILFDSYGDEQYFYEGTPYDYIRYFLRVIRPKAGEVIYDLGAGYGRVVLYGAITSSAQFRGIEIVPDRIQKAQKAIKRFGIRNAEIIAGNALDLDYSDGDIFFLFNPFRKDTLEKIGAKLKEMAAKKDFRLVTWGGNSNDFFESQNWLKKTAEKPVEYAKIDFFSTKKV